MAAPDQNAGMHSLRENPPFIFENMPLFGFSSRYFPGSASFSFSSP